MSTYYTLYRIIIPNAVETHIMVHIIIAKDFLLKPKQGQVIVDHIRADASKWRLKDLQWRTQSANVQAARDMYKEMKKLDGDNGEGEIGKYITNLNSNYFKTHPDAMKLELSETPEEQKFKEEWLPALDVFSQADLQDIEVSTKVRIRHGLTCLTYKPYLTYKGYLCVTIRPITRHIHPIVASTFNSKIMNLDSWSIIYVGKEIAIGHQI